jgi:hypothetical protein
LPGDAEEFGGVLHDDPAVGGVFDEQGSELIGEPDALWGAGSRLLAGDESVA